MFSITQILGLAAGILLMSNAAADPNVQIISVSPIEDSESPLNAVLMIGYVLFGAALALIVIKYFRTKILFRILELGVVGGTVSVLCFSFIFAFTPLDFFTSMTVSIILGGSFAIAKFFYTSLKNYAAILSSAGVAAIFGFSMGFWPALLFIVGLSAYDYWAVFKTRHMLTLAQGLSTNELSFTVTATTNEYSNKARSNEHANTSQSHEYTRKPNPDEVSRLDLGSGDLAVPAMLAVSVFPVAGIVGSLAVVFGSIVSIYLTLKFVVEKHIVLPALPPICLGALIALLISQLILMVI